jgi:hypothetical protein
MGQHTTISPTIQEMHSAQLFFGEIAHDFLMRGLVFSVHCSAHIASRKALGASS